jgi:hypothetical protein
MEQALEVGLAAWPFHEDFNFIQSSEGVYLVQDLLNATRKYPTLFFIPLDFLNDVFRY